MNQLKLEICFLDSAHPEPNARPETFRDAVRGTQHHHGDQHVSLSHHRFLWLPSFRRRHPREHHLQHSQFTSVRRPFRSSV